MKKIFFLIMLFIIVFLIYYYNMDKSIKYLYIGNTSKYNEMIKKHYKPKKLYEYIRNDDYRIMDLINDIKDNIDIDNKTLQNLLVKSNLIVINIGIYDIEYKTNLDYKYSDELIDDIENLLLLIRKYNKDKIYLIGFYNKNKYYDYINRRIKHLCKINNIIYIDIEESIYKQLY